jgi:hypothetical protein
MRGSHLSQILFMMLSLLTLSGCQAGAPAETVATISPSAISTPTPITSSTPIAAPTSIPTSLPTSTSEVGATSTAIVTSTPYPPLSTKGPYLAYMVTMPAGGHSLTILDADASGRAIIPIPEDFSVGKLSAALSPDGEWLAFHTGSARTSDSPDPSDLTLKLMHLPDQEVITVARLLSPDYPANFKRAARFLTDTDPLRFGSDPATTQASIEELFIMGIKGIEWSPDSRYLAFAGEMDGPTSDLYTYDTQTGTINRLTDGYGQMTGEISWSPDGRWIMHMATNDPPGEGWMSNVYTVRADGGKAKDFGAATYFRGWVAADTFRLSDSANGIGDYGLRDINVETGNITSLWSESFNDYTTTLEDGSMAVCGGSYAGDDLPFGVYLLSKDGHREDIMPTEDCYQVAYRGREAHRFVVADRDTGVSGISNDGIIEKISSRFGRMQLSPDYRWLLLINGRANGDMHTIELYDENDNFVRELTTMQPDVVFWRPDSIGVYFAISQQLYYISIPDGEPTLVDSNLVLSQWWNADFQWIQ